MNENSKIIPYDKVPKNNIIRAAKNIKKFKKQKLRELVQNGFINYYDKDFCTNKSSSFSIKTVSLLNVSDAVVLVIFKTNPLESFSGYVIGGQARLLRASLQNNNIDIPVI